MTFTLDGTNGPGGIYGQSPRPTGELIAAPTSTSLVVLAQNNLVLGTGLSGTPAWTTAAATWDSDDMGTGLAMDPNQSGTAWATVRSRPTTSTTDGGVWVINGLPDAPSSMCRVNRPGGVTTADDPEEVTAVTETLSGAPKTVLYVAWGSAGAWRGVVNNRDCSTGAAGKVAWTSLGITGDSCAAWSAIDAVITASAPTTTTIWLGCDVDTTTAPTQVAGLWRVTRDFNGATVTRTAIGDDSSEISQTVAGTSAGSWWHTVSAGPAGARTFAAESLGGKSYISSQVAINPSGSNIVFSSGKGGLWRTTSANGSATFQPAVQGFGAVISNQVAVDPYDASSVAIGDVDWGVLASNDYLSSTVWDDDPTGATTGYPPSGGLLAYSGNRGATPTPLGVWSHNKVDTTTSSWRVTHNDSFPTATGSSAWSTVTPVPSGPPDTSTVPSAALAGFATGNDTSTPPAAQYVAVADNSTTLQIPQLTNPLYWRDGAASGGAWTNATITSRITNSTGVVAGYGGPIDIVWVKGTKTVLMFDVSSGLFRSTDAGHSWTELFAADLANAIGSGGGRMAYDAGASPPRAVITYVKTVLGSKVGVVAQIPNPTTCSPTTCNSSVVTWSSTTGLTQPSAMTVDSTGKVWLAQNSYSPVSLDNPVVRLFRESSPRTKVLTDITDDAYRGAAQDVTSMAAGSCSATGPVCVYIATNGNGTYVFR